MTTDDNWPPYWDLCHRCNRDVEHVNGEPTAHNNTDGVACVDPQPTVLPVPLPSVWWDGSTLYVVFPQSPDYVRMIRARDSSAAFGKVDTANCTEFLPCTSGEARA